MGIDKRISGFGTAVFDERMQPAVKSKGVSMGCDPVVPGWCQFSVANDPSFYRDDRATACKQCKVSDYPLQDYVRATVDVNDVGDNGGHHQREVEIYTMIITPEVTSTSPKTSGRLGGNRITMAGSGFVGGDRHSTKCDVGAVDVTVAGVPCTVESCTAEGLVCTAGVPPRPRDGDGGGGDATGGGEAGLDDLAAAVPTAPFPGSAGVTVKRWDYGSFDGDWGSTPSTKEPIPTGRMFFESPQPFCKHGVVETTKQVHGSKQYSNEKSYALITSGLACCHAACGVCTGSTIDKYTGNVDKKRIGETCAQRSENTGQQCCPPSVNTVSIGFPANHRAKSYTVPIPSTVTCPLDRINVRWHDWTNDADGNRVGWVTDEFDVTVDEAGAAGAGTDTETDTGTDVGTKSSGAQLTFTRVNGDVMGKNAKSITCAVDEAAVIRADVVCTSPTQTSCNMPSGDGAVEVRGFFVPPASANYSFWVMGSGTTSIRLAKASKTFSLQTGPTVAATSIIAESRQRSTTYYESDLQRSERRGGTSSDGGEEGGGTYTWLNGGEHYAFVARQTSRIDPLLYPEQFMQIALRAQNPAPATGPIFGGGAKAVGQYHAVPQQIIISTYCPSCGANSRRQGFFRLLVGGIWSSWLKLSETGKDEMKRTLEQLPIVGKVDVLQYDDHGSQGKTWRVNLLKQGGLQYSVSVSSYDHDAGTNVLSPAEVAATVEEIEAGGGRDWLLDPAPAYLFRQEESEQPATVLVNGLAAACGDEDGCSFQFLDVTPKVTAVACVDGTDGIPCMPMNAGTVEIRDGDTIRVTGTDFAENEATATLATALEKGPEVRFGTAVCRVTRYSSTEITCVMPHTVVGEHAFTIVARHAGRSITQYTDPVSTLVRYVGRLDEIGDDATASMQVPVTGGSVLVLQGTGFSTTLSENRITIGGEACVCTGATHSQIECTTPPATAVGDSAELLTTYGAEIPSATGTAVLFNLFDIADLGKHVVWNWSLVPHVSHFAPTQISAAVTTVFQVSGTFDGFANNNNSNNDNDVDDGSACKHELYFESASNRRRCDELAVEGDAVRCKMGRGPAFLPTLEQATVEPRLRLCADTGSRAFAFNGASSKTLDFGLRIDSVSPKSGSFAGGTVVTVQGAGFASESERNILTGLTMQFEVLSNEIKIETMHRLVPCKILSSTFTKTTCMTARFTAGEFKSYNTSHHGHSGGGINGKLSFAVNAIKVPGVEDDPDAHDHDGIDSGEAHDGLYREYATRIEVGEAGESDGESEAAGESVAHLDGEGDDAYPKCAAPSVKSRGQCETCFASSQCIEGYFCCPYMLKCVESSSMACSTPTARCSPRCFVDRAGVCNEDGCLDCTGCNLGKYSWLEWANLANSATPAEYELTCSSTGTGASGGLVYDRTSGSSSSSVVEPDGIVEEGGDYVPPPIESLTSEQIQEEKGFLLAWINAHRAKSELCVSDALSVAAQAHAREMAGMGMLSHVGASGSTAGVRATNQGYNWVKLYESVAFVPTQSGASAVELWHRRAADQENMVNEEYYEIGIGLHDGYFVVMYGAPGDPLAWSNSLWLTNSLEVNATYRGTACNMCTGKGSPPDDVPNARPAKQSWGVGCCGEPSYWGYCMQTEEKNLCLLQCNDNDCQGKLDFHSICGIGEGYRVGFPSVRKRDKMRSYDNGKDADRGSCRCGKGLKEYMHRTDARVVYRGVVFEENTPWATYCVPASDPNSLLDPNAKRSCSNLVSRRNRRKDVINGIKVNEDVTFDTNDLPPADGTTRRRLRLSALGQMLELEIQDVTSKFVSISGTFAGLRGRRLHANRWYTGSVLGSSSSRVSISIRANGEVHGTIQFAKIEGDATTVIEISSDQDGKARAVPRRADADPEAILRDQRPGFEFGNSTAQQRHGRGEADPAKNTCTVFIDADKWFYDQWGGVGPSWLRKERTILKMLDIMLGAMDVFMFNFAASNGPYLYVSGAAVHESISFAVDNPTQQNDPDRALASYRSFLNSDASSSTRRRADTDQKGNEVCLNHLFTHANFGSVVGLAGLGTACSRNFQNSAFTSTRSGGGVMSAAGSAGVASHEIGHNFNAEHDCEDPEPNGANGACEAFVALADTPDIEAECLGPDDHFIMFPSVSTGANTHRFSPCSKYLIGNLQASLACLVEAPAGLLPDKFSFTTPARSTSSTTSTPEAATTTEKWWHKYHDDASSFTGEFDFTADETPHLTSIWPSSGVCKERITISGIGLETTTHVIMGGEECTGIAATRTAVECSPPNLRAGRYHVKVMTSSGLAAHPIDHSEEVSYVSILRLRALHPRTGSLAGGTVVTVNGNGFGNDASKVTVLVGNEKARITSVSDTAAVIVTPRFNAKSGFTYSQHVVSLPPSTKHCYFPNGDVAALEACKTKIIPNVPANLTCPEQIDRSNWLGAGNEPTQFEVAVDGTTLIVKATRTADRYWKWSHATQFKCTSTTELVAPTHDTPASVMVTVESGNMARDEEYGQLVEVTHSKLKIQPTANCLSCKVPTMAEQAHGGFDIATQHMWTPDTYTALSSSCAATVSERGNSTACAFNYVRDLTPVLESITPQAGQSGTKVIVVGTGFGGGSGGGGGIPTVHIGGSECKINLDMWTDTSIACTVGESMGGTHPVILSIPRVGVAVPNGVSFAASTSVTNVQPASGSYGGGDVVEITGHGFGDEASTAVSFCGSKCVVTEASYEKIKCTTTQLDSAESTKAFKNNEPTNIELDVDGEGGGGSAVKRISDAAGAAVAANAFDSSYYSEYVSSATGECWVGLDFGDGRQAIVSRIRYFPVAMIPRGKTHTLGGFAMKEGRFEGTDSLAEGEPWNLLAKITEPHQGWNWLDVAKERKVAYRYVTTLPPTSFFVNSGTLMRCTDPPLRKGGHPISVLSVW